MELAELLLLLWRRLEPMSTVAILNRMMKMMSYSLNSCIFQRPCDVTDESDVVGLVEQAVSPSGNLDILVNNAGVGLIKQIPDVSECEWDHVMGINLKEPFSVASTRSHICNHPVVLSSIWLAIQGYFLGHTIRFTARVKVHWWHLLKPRALSFQGSYTSQHGLPRAGGEHSDDES